MNFKSKFIKKEKVAEDTYMFSFTKPRGFQYEAGQFTSLYLPSYSDESPIDGKHTFSICSSPKDKELQFATRIRKTDFKKGIMKLKKGEDVELSHPGGSFTLPETDEHPIVFLVGGIGITPVRSILRYVPTIKKNYKIKIFHSNKSEKSTPFYKEFKKELTDAKRDNVEYILTLTGKGGTVSSPVGERGRINAKLIEKYAGDFSKNLFYIVGPEPFTDAMRSLLTKNGVKAEEIKGDTFYGYED